MTPHNSAQVGIPPFASQLEPEYRYTKDRLTTLQINIGPRCNLACKHCHVQGGPNRTESMPREVMLACLQYAREQQIETIDITGGAPELYPHIRELVEGAASIAPHVILRTNLVILTEPGYEDFPNWFREQGVEIVCSLPHYLPHQMNRVRGDQTFERAIQALQTLNAIGYGVEENLRLTLVYNPSGAFFPPPQATLEKEYREALHKAFGVRFHSLITITNNPMGRFQEFLERTGNLDSYMQQLYAAFNPRTVEGLMCRSQLSVRYDGTLYDCDFNQVAELPIAGGQRIEDLLGKPQKARPICFGAHCYACTAGQGSSCGGATDPN